ncbi:PREDICTED: uncharacterized protein LOC108576768 [Habropoda laboriosa]|uniref:uncharacterized protein LOC108576768 n=1 Tax=Habropoda laboriosa TaxID=597456 RepID=UPI00083CF8A5|nr:PREDICTED: uncharacterized protein LOC108576768 [Habropoda laboriosa]
MSVVQACCRDQRKMGQMIDQIKMLSSNLDELRAEINALKTSYLESKESLLHGNDVRKSRDSKINVLHKVKKYMKKVTNTYSRRKEQKSGRSQKAHYPCSNLNGPLPSFLDYIFRIKKKGSEWQIPTTMKYLKNQGNQTKEKFKVQQSMVKSTTVSAPVKTIYRGLSFTKLANEQYNKAIFPTTVQKHSDISCELDLKVQNPMSPSNSEKGVFFKNYPKNINVSSLNNNSKQSATKSTQTKIGKPRRKGRNLHFHSKYPNLYLSKIKNAVIMKKIIRNTNESIFTVCENIGNRKTHLYSQKEICNRCSCRKQTTDFVNSIDQETSERNVSLDKTLEKLKNNETCKSFLFNEEPDLSSSSISVDLEVNISNSSTKLEDFPQRRKPRTYVVRKTTAKHNQNWLNHVERSVIYLGQTSDLTLSSCNISNHSVSFN